MPNVRHHRGRHLDECVGDIPYIMKLDTQGTEFALIQSLGASFSSGQIVGVELEASLLASPLCAEMPRFWEIADWLDRKGYELLKLDVIEDPVQGSMRNSVSYVHECDAVFALRPDLAASRPVEIRAILFAFYVANQLHREALRLLNDDAKLATFFTADGTDVEHLRQVLRTQI